MPFPQKPRALTISHFAELQHLLSKDQRQMRTFLTAEWKYLLKLNYLIDPALLRPYLPNNVELDTQREHWKLCSARCLSLVTISTATC